MATTRKKILTIIGTRPEAIKMAPVVRALERRADRYESVLCVTAQHREMLDQMLAHFGLAPRHDLRVMTENQSPSDVARRVLDELPPVIDAERPDWVVVQGDTTTVAAAALAAAWAGVPVAHVEAGLRSGDPLDPFPEEINRRLVDAVATRCLAPTGAARANLLREGVPDDRIVVTGNTGIDALLMTARRPYAWDDGPLAGLPPDRRLVVFTVHRRESFGAPLRSICEGVRELAEAHAGDVEVVCPVHPNPCVVETVRTVLGGAAGVTLVEPLDYLAMVSLLRRSVLVLTDSGGLQEEAPTLGVPVLVLREVTERPEGVEAGVARVVGTDRQGIVAAAREVLADGSAMARAARGSRLYGDGRAAERVVEVLG